MIEALSFIKNQAGVVPARSELQEDHSAMDEFPFMDIYNWLMNI